MIDKNDETLRLPDGRKLGYRILGDPEGTPLYFFHGTPGSRVCLAPEDQIARIPGLKLICPERPGYGLSDPRPGRSIQDWVEDVVALADALRHDTFHVSGSSGGGPYALVCGECLPDRVRSVLLFNSAAPWDSRDATQGMAFANRLGVWVGRYTPWLIRPLVRMGAKSVQANPQATLQSIRKQLSKPDQDLLDKPEYAAAVLEDLREATRNGTDGHVWDVSASLRPWQIDFANIRCPVRVWHGEQDTLSPLHNVQRMVAQIPDCQTHWLPDAGHLLIDHPIVVQQVAEFLTNEMATSPQSTA